jgi:hypothetical protein
MVVGSGRVRWERLITRMRRMRTRPTSGIALGSKGVFGWAGMERIDEN